MDDVRCVVCAKVAGMALDEWVKVVAFGASIWVCPGDVQEILKQALKLPVGGKRA